MVSNDITPLGRTKISWEIPQQSALVEMYVNPKLLSFKSRKLITKTRTKGGFVIQYWGEEFDALQGSGVVGSSGIEGLDLLREIYRAEQLYADEMVTSPQDAMSLAEAAASVFMHYNGASYRGYFTTFSYSETADELGLFPYQFDFTIIETFGKRKNNLPWQKNPLTGQLSF